MQTTQHPRFSSHTRIKTAEEGSVGCLEHISECPGGSQTDLGVQIARMEKRTHTGHKSDFIKVLQTGPVMAPPPRMTRTEFSISDPPHSRYQNCRGGGGLLVSCLILYRITPVLCVSLFISAHTAVGKTLKGSEHKQQ